MFIHYLGAIEIYSLKGACYFTPKSKTFALGQIANTIFDGNLSLAFHSRYLKEEVAMTYMILAQCI
jgi:hypothetical protein